jgi:2-polyprenyl-6-methoxyphenol hydroxylase-like FAD-dependent oxidoreductase
VRESRFDVAVVGASIAGCTAATLFARAGARVALLESHADPDAYKHACTHMIQSSANPVLGRLGVADELEAAGGVRTTVDIWTELGWIIDTAWQNGGRPVGRNLCVRRSVLDPVLRRHAADTPGVELMLGERVAGVVTECGRVTGVEALAADGQTRRLSAQLVVGADGRGSVVAASARMPRKLSPNARVAYFAYYSGLPLATGTGSQIWLSGADFAYAFPTDGGLTLLAAFPSRRRLAEFKRDPAVALEATYAPLPRAPDIAAAERVTQVLGRLDLENVERPAAMAGVALVGDAALTSDPTVGVGCGWALQSADWLVEETAAALLERGDLDAALKRYRARHGRALGPHQALIVQGAKARLPSRTERMVLSAAAKDEQIARRFHDYSTRNAGPREVMGPRTMLRAAWVDTTRRRPPQP